ncbi:uncharacterized protein LOC62_07G009081 [Vanrija pseudolonga]|uniref:Phosphatidylglycerol lysyltransferase C-terminal domain-containing protein n=1 Tax=Vanrija pseudolonga TaxID=143232 RepID=A0AAF0YEY8_9TREE|nr:hypothetical protein LOC62_07G009081 [Vanrija pseudolonga]
MSPAQQAKQQPPHATSASSAPLESTTVWTASDGTSRISYRRAWGCAVALGDPLCPAAQQQAVTAEFRAFCQQNNWDTVYALTTASFADAAAGAGMGVMSFGSELVLDTRDYFLGGGRGKELRSRLRRASGALDVGVYSAAGSTRDAGLEARLTALANECLGPAHPADLFPSGPLRSWLYATRSDGAVVGLVAMLQLSPQQGYLLEHVLVSPSDARNGTAELLVARTLDHLASLGVPRATFGPAPADHSAAISATAPARRTHARVTRHFKLGEPAGCAAPAPHPHANAVWLCFDPPVFGFRQVSAVMKAFNLRAAGDGVCSPPPAPKRLRRTRNTPFGTVCTPVAGGTVGRTYLSSAAFVSSVVGLVSLSRFSPPPRQATARQPPKALVGLPNPLAMTLARV